MSENLEKTLKEVLEYLEEIKAQVKPGSDFKCPDCLHTEFHHSTCNLKIMIDKIIKEYEDA